MSEPGPPSDRPPAVLNLKAVALPVEHGGWGFLLEPVVLGLLVAPSAAGLLYGVAALGAFLARHPLKLALLDRGKGTRTARTRAAERFVLAYGAAALLALLAAARLGGPRPLLPLLAVAPMGVLQVVYDARNQSRALLPETTGAVALGSLVSAVSLAGGLALAPALGLFALLAARGVAAVLYVRARLRMDRGKGRSVGPTYVSHGAGVGLAAGLANAGWTPWLAVGAFVVLLLRAVFGLSHGHRPVRPKVVGLTELAYGVLTVALLTLGVRLGL
jgi:YwiC-like protein